MFFITYDGIEEAFEAKLVKISASSQAVVVKHKALCLCGGYYSPIWLFQDKSNTASPIWSTKGAGMLELLDKKTNRFRKLKESSGVAMDGY